MMNKITILFIDLAVLVFGTSVTAGDVKNLAAITLQPDKPDTWEKTITEAVAQKKKMAQVLVAAGKDESLSDLTRAKAIEMLLYIETDESVRYLKNNQSLRLYPASREYDDVIFAFLGPCLMSLRCMNWNAGFDIIREGKLYSEETNWKMGLALEMIFGKKLEAVATGKKLSGHNQAFCWTVKADDVGQKNDAPVIDISKPDTWKGHLTKVNEKIDELSHSLAKIAKDEKLSAADRKKAINLLPRIGRSVAYGFLIENVAMTIEKPKKKNGNKYELKDYPCAEALSNSDWNTAHAIVMGATRAKKDKATKSVMTRQDAYLLSKALKKIMGLELATVAVEQELEYCKRWPDHYFHEFSIQNLTRIKTFLGMDESPKDEAKKKDKGGGNLTSE